MSLLDTASLIVTPNGYKAGTLYSVIPNTTLGDLDVTRATTATRVNSSGLIESVASNVPRLDYTNGSCPSILVEPQRTNLLKYSQDLTNINWTTIGLITRTANYGIAPDGTTTSTRIQWNGLANYELFQYSGTASPVFGTVYVKGTAGQTINFNGSVKTFNGSWQRIENLLAVDGSNTYMSFRGIVGSTTALDFEVWGAQGEAGSYATSYIPTTSASVTRNAESLSSLSIPSLFGATEGSFLIDLTFDNTNPNGAIPLFLRSSVNSAFNHATYLQFGTSAVTLNVWNSGTQQVGITGGSFTNGQNIKIGIGYKANDFVLYINGIQLATDTSGSISTSLSFIDIGSYLSAQSTFQYNGKVNLSALWKTRLTNTQIQTLTSL